MTPVKTQGRCASCWAFSAISVMEAYVSIQVNAPPVALSPQSMIDCDMEFRCLAGQMRGLYPPPQGPPPPILRPSQ